MWNKVEEKLPEKKGKYLTWRKAWHKACFEYGYGYYSVDSFSFDLSTIDDFDMQKKKAGFFNYDSEYGYYEVFPTYWTELPEPPRE